MFRSSYFRQRYFKAWYFRGSLALEEIDYTAQGGPIGKRVQPILGFKRTKPLLVFKDAKP